MNISRPSIRLFLALSLTIVANAQDQAPPQASISNGQLQVKLYLPDANRGYYRGTRFDWSGVISSLKYNGHDYYGPWFTKTDPNVIDFIFKGSDIVAGPCSAITGPVEEFSTGEKALGYDEAKSGGTFIKIGVGVLRRPDNKDYNPYRLYKIIEGGKWNVRTNPDSIEFTQELSDPTSGYAYRYTKTVRVTQGMPEMVLEHTLENTGRRAIRTSVYDHNFLVLDKQTTGPDFVITLPFDLKMKGESERELIKIQGSQFTYLRALNGRDTVAGSLSGFSNKPSDYRITIENRKVRAGMRVIGDRPLSRENLWSIRTVVAMEPFIDMSIDPGKAFTWKYTYSYYSLPHTGRRKLPLPRK